MEHRCWSCGLILSIFLSMSTTSFQAPKIELCYHEDASWVVCTWKKSQNYSNLRLYYKDTFMKNCYSQCQPTKIVDNSSMEYCMFESKLIYHKYTLLLAPLENCSVDNFKKCWNCSKEIGEIREKQFFLRDVVVTLPPINFRFESNSILKWNKPEDKTSLLDFVFLHSDPMYKLEYRKPSCSNVIHTKNFNQTWELWYKGNKTSFSPQNLTPGYCYESRVSATLLKPSQAEESWGRPSNVIQFRVDFSPPSSTDVSTLEQTTANSYNPQLELYGSLLAAFLFLFLFCGVICFRKKCLKIFPSKIKVPKPMIMISLKELEEESSYFYTTEKCKEEKVASLKPLLISFFCDINSTTNVTRHEANSEDNEKSTLSTKPASSECSESRKLVETKKPDALESNHVEKALESKTVQLNLEISDFSNLLESNRISASASSLCDSLIEEVQISTSQELTASSSNFKSSRDEGSICNKNKSENQIEESFFPRQLTRSPLDYIGYVTEQCERTSCDLPVSLNEFLFGRIVTKTTTHPETPNSYSGCYNCPNYNTSGFSSLPSVTGYLREFHSSENPHFLRHNSFNSATRSVCSRCPTEHTPQPHVDKQKPKSLGKLTYAFETFKSLQGRNRVDNNLLLDSGCSLDSSVSST